jgi:AAHS family 3-hydroxyphenylpropionic acid transporter
MDNAMTARTGAASTIALCFVVAFLEGFDLQSTGVAAPWIVPDESVP